MSKCKFCGAEVAENTKFCSNCGAMVNNTSSAESAADANNASEVHQARPVYTKRNLKGGMLAWSIINSFLGLIGCCTFLPGISLILGVIALVLTILAQDAKTDKDEKNKIRTSMILNIIATSLFVISIILVIVFVFNISTSPVPYNNFNIDEFMRMYPSLD